MAKTGMSPIERLAKGLVKPVVVKQPTPPVTPTTTPNPFLPSTATTMPPATTSSSAAPLKTYPSSNPFDPAYNVPGNKPFTGPTLDPEVQQARNKLREQSIKATQAGIAPATVQSIQSGKGDPDRGFLGPWNDIKKGLKAVYNFDVIPGDTKIQPFVKAANFDVLPGSAQFKPVKAVGTVAKGGGLKLLKAAAPALDKLDFGFRIVSSLIKEIGDEGAAWLGNRPRGEAGFKAGPGGFSWNDFINQGFAGDLGLGETYKADDPAIIAEAAQYQGITPQQIADQKNKAQAVRGGEMFAEIDNPYANQILGLFADVFLDPLTFTTGPGGIAKTAAQKAVLKGSTEFVARAVAAEADRLAASITKKAAEEAIQIAIANGDDIAEAAARKAALDAAAVIKESLKVTSGATPVRTGGRTSNQALADSVLQIKDDAQRVVDAAVPGNVYTAEKIAQAQRVVDVITPEVIKDIQASGLAGITGTYLDIIKGTRTAAQDVLGVRGGLRFGVPGARVTVKGTETIQTLAGKLASDLRLGFLKTPGAKSLFSKLTPTGEGGLLGSEDLLRLRTGLRQNTLSADEAVDATRLISLDNAYRAAVQQSRRITGGQLNELGLIPQYVIDKGARVMVNEGYDPKLLNGIIQHLQGVKSPATLVGKELEAYNLIRGQLDAFYDEAVEASKATGYTPPRRANYFPQMRSDDALRWAERNPGAAVRLADKLGVDRTWFIGNFQARDLKSGDSWFGYELDAADLNLNRLNEIAKSQRNTNAAGKTFPNPQAVKFDFFETDVLKVLSKYANTHAQFIALQKTLGDLPGQYPSLFRKDDFSVFVPGTGPMIQEAKGVYPRGGILYFPGITSGVPFDANTILQSLDAGELKTLLDDVKKIVSNSRKPLILKDDIDTGINQLQTKLDKIEADFASGILTPPAAAVLSDEVVRLSELLVNDLTRVAPTLSNAPVDKWVEYVNVVRNGFESLNNITAPDIAVRGDIAQLFTDAARMGDKEFAGVVRQALNDYIKFSKAYLVARPGFHVRNGLSNAFTVVAAGASLESIRTGPYLSNAINRGLKSGKTPEQIAESLVDNYLSQQRGFVLGRTPVINIPDRAFSSGGGQAREAAIRALTDAINYSGSTGFGQFGEIAEAVGKTNRGFLQAGDPANKLSAGVGKVLQKSREFGTYIEDVSRFTLTWDGLLKGLTPQQAVARTNKYLIDYGDYSKLDKVGRLIFPFWTFMTRNAPMQLELMLTNPKVYAQYNAFRRNLEDTRTEEEGGIAIPFYEKDRGVFATKEEGFGALIPGNVIRPGLPFEGGGENVLSGLIKNPRQALAGVNPLFRAPLEAFFRGEDGRGAGFFTDAPIVPTSELTYPTRSKLLYLARELASPTSPIRSIVQQTPARRIELLQTLLGMKSDPNDPFTQELQSIYSYGGAPFGIISTEQQLREINSRIYKLADKMEKANKQEAAIKKVDEEKRIANLPDAPATGVNPFLPSTTTP